MTEWLKGLFADGPFPSRQAVGYRRVLITCTLSSTAIAILGTVPDVWGDWQWAIGWAEGATLVVLSLDYLLRLVLAWRSRFDGEAGWRALWRYASSPYGVFDFLAVVPFLMGAALSLSQDGETVFGVLRFLKLARYSLALETLGVVVLSELRPLMAALFIMMLLAVSASTVLYFAERSVNPGFATVPHALWWAIVTLATLGYGDVVPATALGKVLGAGVAVMGLCMFALPASILASGFAEEMRLQNFVSTWHLVAKVPFFTRLQAGQIAEIASLLKLYRAVKGEVLMREGDTGDCMYFLVSGQVEVKARAGTFLLKTGDFFGEIALIEDMPRTATVRTLSRCQLLILDARDFHKFVAGYPNLLEVIWETARQRLANHQQINHQVDA